MGRYLILALLLCLVSWGGWFVFGPTPSERLATLLDEKRWEEAEALASDGLGRAGPEERVALYRSLAITHGRQGEHAEAIKAYRAAHALRPEDDDLRHRVGIETVGIGRDHEDRGDLDQAVARYREAVEIAPEVPHGHDALIAALRTTREPVDDRIDAIRAALAAGSPSVLHRLELARLLATHPDPNKRDAQSALELSQQALMRDRLPETFETYAIATAALGNYEEALRYQLDAIELAGGKDAPGFDERRARLKTYIDEVPDLALQEAAELAP